VNWILCSYSARSATEDVQGKSCSGTGGRHPSRQPSESAEAEKRFCLLSASEVFAKIRVGQQRGCQSCTGPLFEAFEQKAAIGSSYAVCGPIRKGRRVLDLIAPPVEVSTARISSASFSMKVAVRQSESKGLAITRNVQIVKWSAARTWIDHCGNSKQPRNIDQSGVPPGRQQRLR
jgi:hypothetical protein